MDLHEKQMTQRGIHVYLKIWQNRHIHEVKTKDHKTYLKWEYKFECMNHQN